MKEPLTALFIVFCIMVVVIIFVSLCNISMNLTYEIIKPQYNYYIVQQGEKIQLDYTECTSIMIKDGSKLLVTCYNPDNDKVYQGFGSEFITEEK